MSELYWLTDAQIERLRPFFPKSRGRPRVDDQRVLSGTEEVRKQSGGLFSRRRFIQRNGLMWWRHAPAVYGLPKTLYNRWKRLSQMGVFATIGGPSAGDRDRMIDATHAKAHRSASSLAVQRGARTADQADQGRYEFETARPGGCEGPSDPNVPVGGPDIRHIGARALLSLIPSAGALLADRGYDADWFRNARIEVGISPRIPFRTDRKAPIPHDTELYRLRHRIENMFACLKDWRRIATRYDRCPILFLSACA